MPLPHRAGRACLCGWRLNGRQRWSGRVRHRPLTPTLQQLGHESAAEDLSFLTQYLTQSNLTAQQRWEAMVRVRQFGGVLPVRG